MSQSVQQLFLFIHSLDSSFEQESLTTMAQCVMCLDDITQYMSKPIANQIDKLI